MALAVLLIPFTGRPRADDKHAVSGVPEQRCTISFLRWPYDLALLSAKEMTFSHIGFDIAQRMWMILAAVVCNQSDKFVLSATSSCRNLILGAATLTFSSSHTQIVAFIICLHYAPWWSELSNPSLQAPISILTQPDRFRDGYGNLSVTNLCCDRRLYYVLYFFGLVFVHPTLILSGTAGPLVLALHATPLPL